MKKVLSVGLAMLFLVVLAPLAHAKGNECDMDGMLGQIVRASQSIEPEPTYVKAP